MTADWRVAALITAADWLGAGPDAAHRARALADHATDTGEVAELVAALLDCLGVAVDNGDAQRARRRLENRALIAAQKTVDDSP